MCGVWLAYIFEIRTYIQKQHVNIIFFKYLFIKKWGKPIGQKTHFSEQERAAPPTNLSKWICIELVLVCC